MSKVYEKDNNDFSSIIANNYTYSDCLRELGLSTNGGDSLRILKRRIEELGINTEHFDASKSKLYKKHKVQNCYSLEEILIKDSNYSNISRLKKRLVKEKLLTYKCYICNISSWRNKDITLQLDHINGNRRDHRIENLRFLCPNCHSQTETYAGRNTKGKY
ncbi:HNH endonuclease [Staphylococcus phage ESa2]|nr:HNH endonuclease [Staphylococcus phage ESa2]